MNRSAGTSTQGRRALGLAGVGMALVLGWALRPTSLAEPARAEGGPPPKVRPRVAVAKPRVRTIHRVSRLPCDVLAHADAEIAARVTGYVQTVKVDIGSRVEAGAELATLYVPDLAATEATARAMLERARAAVVEARATSTTAQAEADLSPALEAEAQAAVARAEAALARAGAERDYRNLVRERAERVIATAPHVIAQETVDEARSRATLADVEHRDAEAGLEAARAARATAQARTRASAARAAAAEAALASSQAAEKTAQAQLAEATVQAGFAVLRAPFAGVVVQRNVDVGDMVVGDAGRTLFRVLDDRRVRVRLRVPESDVAGCACGRRLVLSVDGLPGPALEVQVARVSEALDLDTRSMLIEADVENAEHRLRHGMFGRVTLDLEAHVDALVVPAQAVTTVKRKSSVLVVEAGKVVKRAVQIGADDGIDIQILEGLTAQEDVIVRGTALVAPGEVVDAQPIASADATRR